MHDRTTEVLAMQLTAAQQAALRHFERHAAARSATARERLAHVLRMSNIPQTQWNAALAWIRTEARVALHFHPDRPDGHGRTVAEALLEGGVYKSQFETGLSSGSVSAHPGGDRDRWEERLFGGAYHGTGASMAERPRYGALDLLGHPDGPAPRFGSCYFLLAPEVTRRCTFTYMDSHREPDERGTLEQPDCILAALLEEAFTRESVLGERDLRPGPLVARLLGGGDRPLGERCRRPAMRNLDHYIEAQVHGPVRLTEDVEALVADPSFEDQPTGQVLRQLGSRYRIDLHWHVGFAMPPDEVPCDFRGPAMRSLAARVASDGQLDASRIGEAVRELKRRPEAWHDRGSPEAVLQELKLLWHVLVRFGQPAGLERRRSAD